MAIDYDRVNFRKRAVQFPRSYTEASDQGGGITHTPHPGEVGDPGVLPNEENMNRMDKGIYDCANAINGMLQTLQAIQRTLLQYNTRIAENADSIADNKDSISAIEAVDTQQTADIESVTQAHGALAANVATDEAAARSHYNNYSNPHKMTKEQLGLGNVQNVSTNDQTPTYSARETDDTLVSGENLSAAMSKLAHAVDRLYEHVNDMNNPHQLKAEDIGAFSPVQGEYEGNGAAERSINLGFQPRIVIWCDETGTFADDIKGTCGGVIYRGRPQYVWAFGNDSGVDRSDPYKVAEITADGFKIYSDNRSTSHTRRQSNKQGIYYHYIAW